MMDFPIQSLIKEFLVKNHSLLKKVIFIFTILLASTVQGISYGQTLTASSAQPLTEATLDGSVVTLTLNGGTYVRFRWDIADALAVSGIPDVTIGTFGPAWFGVDRVSDTRIEVELGFDGDIDADATLTFTVGADAIANYNGPPLTGEIPVSASTETPEQARDVGDTQQPIASKQFEAPEEDSSRDFIEGPWLWMVVPTDPAGGDGISTEIDSLADASGGAITEAGVAQNGVSEGDSIGQLRWTSSEIHWSEHQCKKYSVTRAPNIFLAIFTLGLLQDECIDPTVCWSDNISNVVNTLGMGIELESGARTAYALVNLISPHEQKDVILKAKSGDAMKIWLNGSVVHREAAEDHDCREIDVSLACDPAVCISDPALQESKVSTIPMTLRTGNNLLLVKIRQHGEYWGMKLELAATFTPEIPTSTARIKPSGVAEDVNDDGVVDVQDLVYVAQQYGQTGTNAADVNSDGVVNIQDLILVAGAFGTSAAAPSLHPQALETLTATELKQWISAAQQLDLTDTASQRGILFLEQLLIALTPKETVLLANYPNPFNPETWIPYQLATPADVTLTIYAVNGQIVRRLALGHQAAGVYENRSRAAYWDGRNAVGEPVASGLYFYTLTAGESTATRKMLIRK